jgi:cytochrome c553
MSERSLFEQAVLLVSAVGACVSVAAQESGSAEPDLAALQEEVAALRRLLPSQSHTMIDVEYHFANLWFAGMERNWPLAGFYLNERRSHLNWAVRVRPVRPLAGGGEVDLRPILQGIEAAALTDLRAAIDKQDAAAFESSYRAMLQECSACHEAAEKPFLRPRIPTRPASVLIDMAPQ